MSYESSNGINPVAPAQYLPPSWQLGSNEKIYTIHNIGLTAKKKKKKKCFIKFKKRQQCS